MRLRDLKGRLLQGEPRGGPQAFELHADIRTWNDNPRPYVWTKTADQILPASATTAPELMTQDTRATRPACLTMRVVAFAEC